jgi:MHS family proline/betaine transporter-like MFS transporter
MALPSFLIGLLPDAQHIGLAAPILLVLLRMLQGVAVGGEYMASAVFLVEGAQPHRGGWGLRTFGASAGTPAGLRGRAMWGRSPERCWRGAGIPFIGIGVALGGAIRRHVEHMATGRVRFAVGRRSRLADRLTDRPHRRSASPLHHLRVLRHLAATGSGMPAGCALDSTIAMGLLLVTPLAGSLSDRVGRTILACGAGLLMLLAWPLMALQPGSAGSTRGSWISRAGGRQRRRAPATMAGSPRGGCGVPCCR